MNSYQQYKYSITIILFLCAIVAIYPFAHVFAQESLAISDITIDSTGTDVVVSWRTNKDASGCVLFGTTRQFEYELCATEQNSRLHVLEIANLQPKSLYYYHLISERDNEKIETFDATFKTGKQTDKIAPQIVDSRLEFIGASNVFITVKTTEPTRTYVTYGINAVNERSVRSNSLATEHGIHLPRLKKATIYSYQITVTDDAGLIARTDIRTFMTSSNPESDDQPLRITSITPITQHSPSLGEATAVIQTITSRPARITIRYGTNPERLNNNATIRTYARNQQIILSKLTPDTSYYYQVTATDFLRKSIVGPSKESTYSFKTNPEQTVSQILLPQNQEIGTALKPQEARLTKIVRAIQKQADALQMPALPIPQIQAAQTSIFDELTIRDGIFVVRPLHSTLAYIIFNGKKHEVISQHVMDSYGFDMRDIRALPKQELTSYPDVRLVKSAHSPVVYYIFPEQKQKIAIPNERVFNSYAGNRFEDILVVTQEDLDSYRNAYVVTTNNDSTVNYVVGNTRRPLENADVFNRYNINPKDIATINQTHLETFELGDILR